MSGFDLLEVFLYIIPIAEILLIHFFFKPYLRYKNHFRLSVTDAVLPIILVGMHILSVRLLSFSILPYYLFFVCLSGLLITLYFEKKLSKKPINKIISVVLKLSFLVGFLSYYGIVIARMIQFIRG